MLTNDSIDVFMLQKLQAKQARYLEAMKKGANVLDISDISTHELKTSIITNPETKAKIEIELLKRKLESEKSKFVADSAFVLRKYEDFTKVQSEVAKAQNSYDRIKDYATNTEDSNSDYWQNQLPFYQKSIDLAKSEVQNTIANLASKGVNVTEIEIQTEMTAEKIAIIEAQIEELPLTKNALIIQYKEEKELQLKLNVNRNYVKDRQVENENLFAVEHSRNAASLISKELIQNNNIYESDTLNQNRFAARR